MERTCPCCGGDDFRLAVPRDVIAWETGIRDAFACKRTDGCVGGQALKDRTDFTHARAVDLYECRRCGLLLRGDLDDDFTAVYAGEAYDADVLTHFLERDIRFFAQKAPAYARRLPAGARIVEVGSYAGGFLHVAAAWGWQAVGVDVGEDVTRFANERGYRTYRGTLEGCAFDPASLDGVFIWNCFDQLQDPGGTLAEAHRLLRPGGLLVLRTPNALFYRLCQPLLRASAAEERADPSEHALSEQTLLEQTLSEHTLSEHTLSAHTLSEHTLAKLMGYNNLLGFPYQFGYTPATLRRIVARHGFVPEAVLPSHLMMLPEAEAPAWALAEQRATMHLLDTLGDALSAHAPAANASPWVELTAHRG